MSSMVTRKKSNRFDFLKDEILLEGNLLPDLQSEILNS